MVNRLACNDMEFILCEIKGRLGKGKIIKYLNTLEDEEAKEIATYLKSHSMTVFPYEYRDKYKVSDVRINKDEASGLLYGEIFGKKIYLKKKYTSNFRAARYLSNIRMEQDPKSPHCYTDETFRPDPDSVIFDIGGAEGIFGLEFIDEVKHVYIFECDDDWVEAMKVTYKDYLDKVTFINKFAGNVNSDTHVTLDHIVEENDLWNEKIFVKMDAESDELKILEGAKNLLEKVEHVKLNVCVYHKQDHEQKVRDLLKGWKIAATKGYMLYYYDFDFTNPYLRRGVLRIEK